MTAIETRKGTRKSDDSAWFFDFRRKWSHFSDDESDSGDDHDAIGTETRKDEPRSEEARLFNEIDLSSREETVTYKPNPFSLAKINAATRAQAQSTNKSNITGDGHANTVKNAHIITSTDATVKTGITNPIKRIVPAVNSLKNRGKGLSNATKNGNIMEGLKRQAEKALTKQLLPERCTRLENNSGVLTDQLSRTAEQPSSDLHNCVQDRFLISPTAKEESPGPRHIVAVPTYDRPRASLPNESSPFAIGLQHSLLRSHPPPPLGPPKLLQSPQTMQGPSNLLRLTRCHTPTDSGYILSATRRHCTPPNVSQPQYTPQKAIKPEVETQPGWRQPYSNTFVTPIKPAPIQPRQKLVSPMTPVCKIPTPVTIKKQEFSSPLKYDPGPPVHPRVAKLEARTLSPVVSTPVTPNTFVSGNPMKRETIVQVSALRARDAYCYTVDDPDEEWSTLPARKKLKQSPSSSLNGIKTSGPIRLPALLVPTTSVVSQQRVKTFIPPPIRTHIPGEVIDFLSPADNRHSSINSSTSNPRPLHVDEATLNGNSSGSSNGIHRRELGLRFIGARNQTKSLPSPPTSDSGPIPQPK